MGRTQRSRSRKRKDDRVFSIDCDETIIHLKQWMKRNGWSDNTMRLSVSDKMGRGITSSKTLCKSDTLIEVPYELMITYTSIKNFFLSSSFFLDSSTLKMHDLLSIFLVFERHKGRKSKWQAYIDSLPTSVPLLPWLCRGEEIKKLPAELIPHVQDKISAFTSSWLRSKESISSRWTCECCGVGGDCVLSLNSFTWAYAMVNTRAVYVDPDIVRELSGDSANSRGRSLSDDPCMALCPYLDMFNHSNKAVTGARLEKFDNHLKFKLTTLTPYNKFEEVFISYGAHSNMKLLMEYGFFIPDNELDAISLDFEEVLQCVALSINKRQYNFICQKGLNRGLEITINGLSFNLKASLFVMINSDVEDWCSYVYSGKYSREHLFQMYEVIRHLVQHKIEECSSEVLSLNKNIQDFSQTFQNVIKYMKHKVNFMKIVFCHINEQINR